MEPVSLNPAQQREVIPEESVKAAFLRRDDIASLLPDEQQRSWAAHQIGLERFRKLLEGRDIFVIDEDPDANPPQDVKP